MGKAGEMKMYRAMPQMKYCKRDEPKWIYAKARTQKTHEGAR